MEGLTKYIKSKGWGGSYSNQKQRDVEDLTAIKSKGLGGSNNNQKQRIRKL